MSGKEQRHPVFPAHQVGAPAEYPPPGPGPVTTWQLHTPRGEPIGTLRWNKGGCEWTFASGVGLDAQKHGAELLQFLRGHWAEGIAQADALAGIRDAYDGDLDEQR